MFCSPSRGNAFSQMRAFLKSAILGGSFYKLKALWRWHETKPQLHFSQNKMKYLLPTLRSSSALTSSMVTSNRFCTSLNTPVTMRGRGKNSRRSSSIKLEQMDLGHRWAWGRQLGGRSAKFRPGEKVVFGPPGGGGRTSSAFLRGKRGGGNKRQTPKKILDSR